jgi:hypothetical protein
MENGKITKELFKEVVKHFDKLGKQPSQLFISQKQYQKIWYWSNSIIIAEYPGYEKWQGPDNKTWFEKIDINKDKYYGSGNKSRRRMGHKYHDDSWYGGYWSKE